MSQLLVQLSEFNSKINTFIWDKLGLVLLIFTGLLFTIGTNFFQIRYFFHWIKKPFEGVFRPKKKESSGTITQMQALCTSLASTIGVGSIVGVSAAIKTGGCGAVFWMWVAAFFSMMTAYAENVLGIYFREKNKKGIWQGGCMYILEKSIGGKKPFKMLSKVLGISFCIFCVFASFGIGNLGQVNKITENIIYAFPLPCVSSFLVAGIPLYNLIIAFCLTLICGFVILGGLKRIASLAEKIIPFMVVFFVLGSTSVIFVHRENIVEAFKHIFTEAFSFKAATGAVSGLTLKTIITTGFKRGLFSTEAGMGSTVLINISSDVKEPVVQGMWGIFQVFVDTFLICTMTALVILTSKVPLTLADSVMVTEAFGSVFAGFGNKFVAISIFMFAFTSIIGWSQYAVSALSYLNLPYAEKIYKLAFISVIPLGTVINSELTWSICDTFNGLMMLPNLTAILFLFPLVIKISRNYTDRTFKNKKITPLLSFDRHIQLKHQMALKRENK